MHWVVRLLPGGQVTAGIAAIGGRDLQGIVVVDVALRTLQIGMAIRQRKTSGAVIECRSIPTRRGMTIDAIRGRKKRTGSRVWRIVGFLPIGQVAA